MAASFSLKSSPLQPMFQVWLDAYMRPRGERRIATSAWTEQEWEKLVHFDSHSRVPGLTRCYVVDHLGDRHEMPADVFQQILRTPDTVACMWCGKELSQDAIDEHEDRCVA